MLTRVSQLVGLIEKLDKPLNIGAEIGVYEAHVSVELLREFPTLEMILIDSWRPFEGGDWISTQPIEYFAEMLRNTIKRLDKHLTRARIIQWDSPAAAKLIDDESLDFAFIDANHTYPAVRKDILIWWDRVREGGFLAGHDYVEEDNPLGPGGRGVKKAVIEFANELQLRYYTGADSVWWIYKE